MLVIGMLVDSMYLHLETKFLLQWKKELVLNGTLDLLQTKQVTEKVQNTVTGDGQELRMTHLL